MLRRIAIAVLLAAAACTDQDFVADVPLRVVAASPTGESVGVGRHTAITVTFSEKLVADSVAGAFTLESLGYPDATGQPQAVEFVAAYTEDTVPTVTLTPKAPFAFSTIYRVKIATTLERARDKGPLPVAVSWKFHTADPPALLVQRVEPADGASGVARDAVVKVTFSEPVACESLQGGNAVLSERYDPHPHTSEGGPSKDIAGSWDCQAVDPAADVTLDGQWCLTDPSKCVVTFKPDDPKFLFRYSSHVTVTLKGGTAADKPIASARATPYGGQLPTTVTSLWRAVDPAAISVGASVPGAGAGQVARDAKISLTFSEPIDCTRLSADLAKLEQKFDAHPRLGAKAGTVEGVPGSWACTTAAAEEQSPTICATKPELCTAVFTPAPGFLYEWSSDVTLTLAGGAYTPDVAPAAVTSVESARATTHGGQLPETVTVAFHVVDPPAIVVAAALPAPSAIGVSRNPTISLTFSEPPDCASLNDLAVTARTETFDPHPRLGATAGTTVTLAGAWSCPAPDAAVPYACAPGAADPCVATFQPAAGVLAFEWSTSVAIDLAGGAFDAAKRVVESTRATSRGGQLPAPLAQHFRVADPPPISVVGTAPGDGSTGVGRSPVLEVAFSEPPRCELLSNAMIVVVSATEDAHPRLAGKASPREVGGTWSCPPPAASDPYACGGAAAADPCIATFTPAAGQVPLDASTTVGILLKGGAYAAGAPLSAAKFMESTRATTRGGELPLDVDVQFRVEDPLPQLVVGTKPGNGATGVIATTPGNLELSFAEPLACATVNSNTVTASVARADGTAVTYSYTLSCTDASKTVLLTPASGALPYAATVTVRVSGGAFGASPHGPYPDGAVESDDATTRGGQLKADYTFSFTTEDAPPLLLKAASPSDGAVGIALDVPVAAAFTESLDCASIGAGTFLVSEEYATPDDPTRTAPAPAALACTFTCPASGDPAAVSCAHAAFQKSSTVEARLLGGADAASSIRSQAATATSGYLKAPAVVVRFRAQDPAPLSLVANEPNGDPGIDVSADTDVRLTFDRPIRCATASGSVELHDVSAATGPIAATLACTDGTSVGPDVAGATAILTPSAALTVDHTYEVRLAAGIAAADATRVGANVYGKLEQAVSFRFVVAHEDLHVVTTTPKGGASAVPIGSNIAIRFNQDVSLSSLKPCTGLGTPAGCNLWINPGAAPDAAKAIPLTLVGYDNVNFTATFDPSDPLNAPHLQANTAYAVELLSGSRGPVGANGISRLPADYGWTFTSSNNNLVLAVLPPDASTGNDVTAKVCAEFASDVTAASLTAGGNQITLTYSDAFGRTAQVPLSTTTPYTVSGINGLTANFVCLNLAEAPTPCCGGLRRLLYDTAYTGRVSTKVDVGGQLLPAPFAWTFQTRSAPQIAGVRKKNAVVNEPLVAGENEVPVNSAFTVQFAEVMDAATLTAANVSLVSVGNSTPVAATLTLDDPANPLAVTLSLSSAMDFADAAANKGQYALQLLGGSGGVATKRGDYLGADVRYAFTTSPVTSLVIGPPETTIDVMVFVPVESTGRALYLPSVTSGSVYATYRGAAIGGIVAQQALQPLAVSYIANPSYLANQATAYVIQTTGAVLDFRGNPVPPKVSQTYSSGVTADQAGSVNPTAATAADVAPAAGPTANGDQSFTFTLPGTGAVQRMLGSSYYAADPGAPVDNGTISLAATGGAGCPAANTRLALEVRHEIGTAATADRVHIAVAKAPYMKAGCQYRLTIHQERTANIYNVGAGAALTLAYTGETTAPTLTSVQVQQLGGGFVAAGGAANVFGGTAVRATFSEPIAPASVSPATFSLSGGIAGSYDVSGNVVTFRPSVHLSAGTAYTVTLAGLIDLAGNAFAGASATFTVESTAPAFTAVSFDPAQGRDAPFGTVTLTFSEPVDPATIAVNQAGGLGSLSPAAAGSPLFGCATRDPANPSRVLWRPAAALAAGAAVDVTVNPAGAVATLADLAGTAVPTTTRRFTP
ncbi:MAG TPA: Ig-like domain-containing protein [Myxococcales bacterium]